VEVDDDGGQSAITSIFLSAVKGISNARKYLMRFHVEPKMMAALSGIENEYTFLAESNEAATLFTRQ